jgi:hypothetical protein
VIRRLIRLVTDGPAPSHIHGYYDLVGHSRAIVLYLEAIGYVSVTYPRQRGAVEVS